MATIAEGKPSPHDDILINVEAFRGAIRKGDWKLIKIATLPGKTELFNLAKDPGEKKNVAAKYPDRAGPRRPADGVRKGEEALRLDQSPARLCRRSRKDGV